METTASLSELIAPCGMNCARCSAYMAYVNQLPRRKGISHCTGCRPRGKMCAYIKRDCALLRGDKIRFCYECSSFPCPHLSHLDERYRTRYGASPIANLREIQAHGMASLLKKERDGHSCPICGEALCIHNGKCYRCQEISSWKG